MTEPIISIADAISTQIDDEVVVMSLAPQGSRYYGLRGAGTRLWALLKEGGRTRSDLAAQLHREFDIDKMTAAADVERVVDGLVERGLVREG